MTTEVFLRYSPVGQTCILPVYGRCGSGIGVMILRREIWTVIKIELIEKIELIIM